MKTRYWVDLCCFEVSADSPEEAAKIVEEKMKNGELPDVNNVEEIEIDNTRCYYCKSHETEDNGVVLIKKGENVVCEDCISSLHLEEFK